MFSIFEFPTRLVKQQKLNEFARVLRGDGEELFDYEENAQVVDVMKKIFESGMLDSFAVGDLELSRARQEIDGLGRAMVQLVRSGKSTPEQRYFRIATIIM